MAGVNDAPLYTAAPTPAPTGNPITDINRAFDWLRDFTSARGFLMWQLANVAIARITSIE